MSVVSAAEDFLRARLQAAFSPQSLEILDESCLHAGHVGANASGTGSHFRVRIVARAFHGLPRVQRHRLIYQALRQEREESGALAFGIHALAISALSPQEAVA